MTDSNELQRYIINVLCCLSTMDHDADFLTCSSPSPKALSTSLTLSGVQLYPIRPIRHILPA